MTLKLSKVKYGKDDRFVPVHATRATNSGEVHWAERSSDWPVSGGVHWQSDALLGQSAAACIGRAML